MKKFKNGFGFNDGKYSGVTLGFTIDLGKSTNKTVIGLMGN